MAKDTTLAERHIGLQAWLMDSCSSLNMSILDLVRNQPLVHALFQQDLQTLIEAYRTNTAPPIKEISELGQTRYAASQITKFAGQ